LIVRIYYYLLYTIWINIRKNNNLKRYSNEIILAYGDLHLPYCHRDSLEFLQSVKDRFNPDRVINMGDLMDFYSVSEYPKSIDHKDSWPVELKKARKMIAELAEIFPEQTLLSSNHCDRPYKKSRVAGVPREFMVPYTEIIGSPAGWKIKKEVRLTVDSTRTKFLFSHTLNGGALPAAKTLGVSVVLGHSHTKHGASAFNNGENLIWGVDVGCLISDEGAPYAYNRTQLGRPIRGCCIILDGVPHMIPMGR